MLREASRFTRPYTPPSHIQHQWVTAEARAERHKMIRVKDSTIPTPFKFHSLDGLRQRFFRNTPHLSGFGSTTRFSHPGSALQWDEIGYGEPSSCFYLSWNFINNDENILSDTALQRPNLPSSRRLIPRHLPVLFSNTPTAYASHQLFAEVSSPALGCNRDSQ